MTVTRFKDSFSGGSQKTDYEYIYIEAPFQEAIDHFEERFDRDPRRVTCECCGKDFDIRTYEDIQQATGWERDCTFDDGWYIEEARDPHYSQYRTVDEWLDRDDTLYIESGSI